MDRKIAGTLAAAGAALGLVLIPAGTASAHTYPVCVNHGGQLPPGQQPFCNGEGLTQGYLTPGHFPHDRS